MKFAYTVTERQGKKYWTRVGVVFENRDGSQTVRLDALPVNGELLLREDTRQQRDTRSPPIDEHDPF